MKTNIIYNEDCLGGSRNYSMIALTLFTLTLHLIVERIINHTTINGSVIFNKQYLPYNEAQLKRFTKADGTGRKYKPITKTRRIYLDEAKGIPVSDVWTDIASFQTVVNSPEITGYSTQKPEALLERIIKASSNKGDIVLDAFCGCGTTLVVAQKLERNWIGIDISPTAVKVTKARLKKTIKNKGEKIEERKGK